MKALTAAAVFLIAFAAIPAALAASLEPSSRAAEPEAPGLGLDPSGGAAHEIPPTTFT